MTSAVVRSVMRAAVHGIVQVAPSSGVEHIQNGTFADATGWTVGLDWDITGGQANGTPGLSELLNTLSVPVQSGADVSTFGANVGNIGGNNVLISLRSDFDDVAIYFGSADGAITTNTSPSLTHGPYHSLVIVNNDGADPISIDDVTLIY